MSLYTRHRPKSLEKMIGNEATIKKIQTWAKNPKRAHSILLTGPSGCGKTTAARIMASLVGCSGTDFRELDTADFRGIDTVRQLRSQMDYLPMDSECRVWLLDECHKLTGDAQNALLKALEEPPAHVYFILATTNPEKLIKTIKTRCTNFSFDLLKEKELTSLVQLVCKREKVQLKEKTITNIVEKAGGSPRQCLSVLEQVLKMDNPDVELADIEQSEKQAIDLCRALMKKAPWKVIAKLIKEIEAEPESIRQVVLGYCNTCLLGGQEEAFLIMEPFLQEPFYEAGKSRLTACCYEALYAE